MMNKTLCFLQTSAVFLAVIGIGIFVAHKSFISSRVQEEIVLNNGSVAYEKWLNPPTTVLFKVWIYNITNGEKFMEDPSIDLEFTEVGPYVYEEIKVKNIINETEDEIYHIPQTVYHFRSNLSGKLSLDDKFTTLNIPMLTLAGMDETFQHIDPKQLQFVKSMVKAYFKQNPTEKSTIITRTVDELVLGGYKAQVFEYLRQFSSKSSLKMPDLFNIILERNNTQMAGRWKINKGVKETSKLASLISWNDLTDNRIWQENFTCTQLKGTDGQQFPTGVEEQSDIQVFLWDFCRPFKFTFSHNDDVHCVDTMKFKMNPIFDSEILSDQCYCMKRLDLCYHKGLMDISPCRYGSPIILSQPHFYHAHDDLIPKNNTKSSEKDGSYLSIEPWTGIPLSVSIKFQLNFDLKSYELLELTHKRQMVPLVWFEESAIADEESINQLNSTLFDKILIVRVVAGVFVALAVLFIFASLVHRYKLKRSQFV